MILRELYIDGKLVDLDDSVKINRIFTTPFFADVSQLKNDSTYPIKLPKTAVNAAIMEYIDREDSDSSYPYIIHRADYYVNNRAVFTNAEVKVTAPFEIQCVYGVDRIKYARLFDKINEIKTDEIIYDEMGNYVSETNVDARGIDAADWIVNWRKTNMYNQNKPYDYIDYVSGARKSELTFINGNQQPTPTAPIPYNSNLKEMTMHPFIKFSSITKLASQYCYNPIQLTIVSGDGWIYTVKEKVTDNINVGDWLDDVSINPNKIYAIGGDYSIEFENYVEFDADDIITIKSTVTGFDAIDSIYNNNGVILSGGEADKKNVPQFETLYSAPVDGGASLAIKLVETAKTGGFLVVDLLRLYLNQNLLFKYPMTAYITLQFKIEFTTVGGATYGIKLYRRTIGSADAGELIQVVPISAVVNSTTSLYDTIVEIEIKDDGYEYFFKVITGYTMTEGVNPNGAYINGSLRVDNAIYSLSSSYDGYYPVIDNLPKETVLSMLQNMAITFGQFVGFDSNGNIRYYSLDTIKQNIINGNVYDWTGLISNVQKSDFKFNSNAQSNYIKFANDKDLKDRKGNITVNDKTLQIEKDLITFLWDSPLGEENAKSEYSNYEQSIKTDSFENKYIGNSGKCAYCYNDNGVARNPNATYTYFTTYQKLINRPRVNEVTVKLPFEKAINIDFEVPIYVGEWGKYCMLLELEAPDDELCSAKLLLINQIL